MSFSDYSSDEDFDDAVEGEEPVPRAPGPLVSERSVIREDSSIQVGAGVLVAMGITAAAILFRILHQKRRSGRHEASDDIVGEESRAEIEQEAGNDAQGPLASRKRVGQRAESSDLSTASLGALDTARGPAKKHPRGAHTDDVGMAAADAAVLEERRELEQKAKKSSSSTRARKPKSHAHQSGSSALASQALGANSIGPGAEDKDPASPDASQGDDGGDEAAGTAKALPAHASQSGAAQDTEHLASSGAKETGGRAEQQPSSKGNTDGQGEPPAGPGEDSKSQRGEDQAAASGRPTSDSIPPGRPEPKKEQKPQPKADHPCEEPGQDQASAGPDPARAPDASAAAPRPTGAPSCSVQTNSAEEQEQASPAPRRPSSVRDMVKGLEGGRATAPSSGPAAAPPRRQPGADASLEMPGQSDVGAGKSAPSLPAQPVLQEEASRPEVAPAQATAPGPQALEPAAATAEPADSKLDPSERKDSQAAHPPGSNKEHSPSEKEQLPGDGSAEPEQPLATSGRTPAPAQSEGGDEMRTKAEHPSSEGAAVDGGQRGASNGHDGKPGDDMALSKEGASLESKGSGPPPPPAFSPGEPEVLAIRQMSTKAAERKAAQIAASPPKIQPSPAAEVDTFAAETATFNMLMEGSGPSEGKAVADGKGKQAKQENGGSEQSGKPQANAPADGKPSAGEAPSAPAKPPANTGSAAPPAASDKPPVVDLSAVEPQPVDTFSAETSAVNMLVEEPEKAGKESHSKGAAAAEAGDAGRKSDDQPQQPKPSKGLRDGEEASLDAPPEAQASVQKASDASAKAADAGPSSGPDGGSNGDKHVNSPGNAQTADLLGTLAQLGSKGKGSAAAAEGPSTSVPRATKPPPASKFAEVQSTLRPEAAEWRPGKAK